MAMSTNNAELDAAIESIKNYAERFSFGTCSMFTDYSFGVPCGYIRITKESRENWPMGIFQNATYFTALIQNDTERPIGSVSIMSTNEMPTNNRGSRYSVSCNNHKSGFKARNANHRDLSGIVKHICKQIEKFAS